MTIENTNHVAAPHASKLKLRVDCACVLGRERRIGCEDDVFEEDRDG